jgi:hypothetical protein
MTAATATAAMQRSHGTGTLAVKLSAGRTRIDRLHQSGNAKIRVPKTYGEALEAVLINTSGGVTGGDTLSWTLEAGPMTQAVVTTQACERIYKSTGEAGLQNSVIRVANGASLFWLPQETILFDGGRFRRTLDVALTKAPALSASKRLSSAARRWAKQSPPVFSTTAGASGAAAGWSMPTIFASIFPPPSIRRTWRNWATTVLPQRLSRSCRTMTNSLIWL